MSGNTVWDCPGQASVEVLEAIAQTADVDPMSMETPLYDVVDTDALDTLVSTSQSVCVAFEYDGYEVVVSGNGTISVDGVEAEEH
jgi:hypothetical protein